MSFPATVLINAAGRGSRLGLGINKALVELDGASLIEWQLRFLPKDIPIIIGVGYQANEVMAKALQVRKDLLFNFNPDFVSTGTASTLIGSAEIASGRVVSLDADLLVDPEDLLHFINSPGNLVGICSTSSVEPVFATMVDVNGIPNVAGFSRHVDEGLVQMEWTGLINCLASSLIQTRTTGHVFQLIEGLLPIRAREIKSRELDFAEELPAFTDWLKELRKRYL